MKSLNKVLLFVFIIFILIIIVELGYYFYADSFKNNTFAINQKLPPTQICTTVKPSSQNPLNGVLIELLKDVPKYALVSSIVTTTYQGKIIDIGEKEGIKKLDQSKFKNITTKDNYKYNLTLRLKRDGDDDNLVFYINDDNLSQVIEKDNNQEKVINKKDLKIGDEVTIIGKVDLIQKDCFKSGCTIYKITKNK